MILASAIAAHNEPNPTSRLAVWRDQHKRTADRVKLVPAAWHRSGPAAAAAVAAACCLPVGGGDVYRPGCGRGATPPPPTINDVALFDGRPLYAARRRPAAVRSSPGSAGPAGRRRSSESPSETAGVLAGSLRFTQGPEERAEVLTGCSGHTIVL